MIRVHHRLVRRKYLKTWKIWPSHSRLPFGSLRTENGQLRTDKRFTGQRLDQSGLYYYNARYYDATIGRFISPDTIVPNPANPQSLNRYSYCLNNPLRYVDPSGHQWSVPSIEQILAYVAAQQAAADQAIAGVGYVGLTNPVYRTGMGEITSNPVYRGGEAVATPCGSTTPAWTTQATEKSIPFKDARMVIRRPNVLTLFLGSRMGYVVGDLKLSGEARFVTANGLTEVSLSVIGKVALQQENDITLGQFIPVVVCRTFDGETRYKMSSVPGWYARSPEDVFHQHWRVSVPPVPEECSEMYISYRWYVAFDDKSIEEGRAYMDPNGLKIDLKQEKVSGIGPNVRL